MADALQMLSTSVAALADQVRTHAATLRASAAQIHWESIGAAAFRSQAERIASEALVCSGRLRAGADELHTQSVLARTGG